MLAEELPMAPSALLLRLEGVAEDAERDLRAALVDISKSQVRPSLGSVNVKESGEVVRC